MKGNSLDEKLLFLIIILLESKQLAAVKTRKNKNRQTQKLNVDVFFLHSSFSLKYFFSSVY